MPRKLLLVRTVISLIHLLAALSESESEVEEVIMPKRPKKQEMPAVEENGDDADEEEEEEEEEEGDEEEDEEETTYVRHPATIPVLSLKWEVATLLKRS